MAPEVTQNRPPEGSLLAAKFSALWEKSVFLPSVDEFLSQHPQPTTRELADVLITDQFYRWRTDSLIPVERYFKKFPTIAADPDLKLELIVQEFELLSKSADFYSRPRIADYVSRFPDLKEKLNSPNDKTITDKSNPLCADLTTDVSDSEAPTTTNISDFAKSDAVQSTDFDYSFYLLNHDTFAPLPKDVVDVLRSKMHERTFQDGEFLMQQGETATSLMLICKGVVEVSTREGDGKRHYIARSGPGEVMGEMALLSDELRSADVMADQTVKCLVLPAESFHELAEQFPSISKVLTQIVSTRLGGRTRDVLAGKEFDGYKIKQRLGQGGMAIVYEANEVATGRQVALKMMSHRLVYDRAALNLFKREADIIKSFEHPNIVKMYGRFRAFNTYFIVLEYCDGISVETILRNFGPLPETEFRKIIGQVIQAIAYAHSTDVVHRDIKPSNIMINSDGTVKLMDFGLAKPIDDLNASRVDPIVGTPRYMPPEQLAGNAVGKEADYYALGCTAYKMLTGKSLFTENDVKELRRRHRTWTSPSLSELCPGIDSEICRLLTPSLSKERAFRTLDLERLADWAAPVDIDMFTGEALEQVTDVGNWYNDTIME